jgi:hypothetical protein
VIFGGGTACNFAVTEASATINTCKFPAGRPSAEMQAMRRTGRHWKIKLVAIQADDLLNGDRSA